MPPELGRWVGDRCWDGFTSVIDGSDMRWSWWWWCGFGSMIDGWDVGWSRWWVWVGDRWRRCGVVSMVVAWVWVGGFRVVYDGGLIWWVCIGGFFFLISPAIIYNLLRNMNIYRWVCVWWVCIGKSLYLMGWSGLVALYPMVGLYLMGFVMVGGGGGFLWQRGWWWVAKRERQWERDKHWWRRRVGERLD